MSDFIDYITDEEAWTKFLELLGDKENWQQLVESQQAKHSALFQSWALRAALHRLDRGFQENFLSTAVNRSSVLSHAQDRQYVPRKRNPATGPASITNSGDSSIALPVNSLLVADDQKNYILSDSVVINPGETRTVNIVQSSIETRTFTIEETKPFTEYLIDRETTPAVWQLEVLVDGQHWNPAQGFFNIGQTDQVYSEFYAGTDQTGIRFGNGIFGAIPQVGSTVTVKLFLTDGDTSLIAGQPLTPAGDLAYSDSLQIVTAGYIGGGATGETTDEIRLNALYYPLYDENLVWRDDYRFQVRRTVPNIVWLQVWGEQQAEEMYGYNLAHINTIYFAVHSDSDPDIVANVQAALEQVEPLNRRFEHDPVEHVSFSLAISGVLRRTIGINDAETTIRTLLQDCYGRDSRKRKENIKIKDIWKLVLETKLFETGVEQEDFEIVVNGQIEATSIKQMVSIDMDNTTIDLRYE